MKATTPFMPMRIPGVAIPCSASSEAMTEKAVPTRTVRLSRTPGAGDREGQRRERGCERGQADAAEVNLAAEVSVLVRQRIDQGEWKRGNDDAES